VTPGRAGAPRLRERRDPTPGARRIAVAAILLTLAAATGDCAGRAREPGAVAAAKAGR
jgi:hypothetical protein